MPVYIIPLMIVLPILIGVAVGYVSGLCLKKEKSYLVTQGILIFFILIVSGIGFFFNNSVMPKPVLNFMLIGMAFSTMFANMVSERRLGQIMKGFNPILNVLMIMVILNLGAPLDYHLMFKAGIFTATYILSRALGKYFGVLIGARITHLPKKVQKYLGLTMLPHSGVSLIFTGIAISLLDKQAPECSQILQGTITAAAIINEVIAVIVAKKGFELAGELNG